MEHNGIMTHEQIKKVFNDTYNYFYLKWKDIKTAEDFKLMWAEAKEITRKHNDCKLCKDILLYLCNNIEQEFKQRKGEG